MADEALVDVLEGTQRQMREAVWGKHRAIVGDNQDPEARGRLRVRVPSVLGEELSSWAPAVVPYGGAEGEGMLMVPPVGAQVVVEFLGGDRSHPVWTGAVWQSRVSVPEDFAGPDQKVIRTGSGHTVILDDTADTEVLTVRSAAGAEIVLDETGSARLSDKAGQTVTLDAEGNEIVLQDTNGNAITMNSSGIEMADGSGSNIALSGGSIDISASAGVTINGASITLGDVMTEELVKKSFLDIVYTAHVHPGIGAPPTPIPYVANVTAKTKAG